MRKVLILFLGIVLGCVAVNAQDELPPEESHPQIGEVIPDLTFSNVEYYKSDKLSFSDFRGKWLFIDFWFPGCHNCIWTLKPFSELQRQFRKDIQFVLIGSNEKHHGTEQVYSKLSKKQDLQLISVYDSVVNTRWGIWSMPHIIVVDPEGIIRYVTTGQDLTAQKVRSLIDGERVSLYPIDVSEEGSDKFEYEPILDDHTLYGSRISSWNGEPSKGWDVNYFVKYPDDYKKEGFHIRAVTLPQLYAQAYVGQFMWGLVNYVISQMRGDAYYGTEVAHLYGKLYPRVVVEVSDQKPFSYDKNHPRNGGVYNYDLETHNLNITRAELMQTLQLDLKNCFGYEAAIEERLMPCYKLVADTLKLQKLRSIHDKFWISPGSTAAGFEANHISTKRFLLEVTDYISDGMPLLLDETGVDYTLDIKIDADLTDKDEVIKKLRKIGMDIVKDTKLIDVIVIRDGGKVP